MNITTTRALSCLNYLRVSVRPGVYRQEDLVSNNLNCGKVVSKFVVLILFAFEILWTGYQTKLNVIVVMKSVEPRSVSGQLIPVVQM